MPKRPEPDQKLQAKVKALKQQAKSIADDKERRFMRVIEDWLKPGRADKD